VVHFIGSYPGIIHFIVVYYNTKIDILQ